METHERRPEADNRCHAAPIPRIRERWEMNAAAVYAARMG